MGIVHNWDHWVPMMDHGRLKNLKVKGWQNIKLSICEKKGFSAPPYLPKHSVIAGDMSKHKYGCLCKRRGVRKYDAICRHLKQYVWCKREKFLRGDYLDMLNGINMKYKIDMINNINGINRIKKIYRINRFNRMNGMNGINGATGMNSFARETLKQCSSGILASKKEPGSTAEQWARGCRSRVTTRGTVVSPLQPMRAGRY